MSGVLYATGGRVLMSGGAAVEVPATGTLVITTPATMPTLYAGQALSFAFQSWGGTAPYSYSMTASPNTGGWLTGALASNGLVVGSSPPGGATETLTVTVTDAHSNTYTGIFTLAVVVTTGALAIQSTTALPNGTVGGVYFYKLSATGGIPPYTFTYGSTGVNMGTINDESILTPSTNSWMVTLDGYLICAPTAAESVSLPIYVVDSAGNTSTATFTVTTDSVLRVMGLPFDRSSGKIPTVNLGAAYQHTFTAAGGSGSGYTWTVSAGALPTGLSLSSAGVITGTPSGSAGSGSVTAKVVDSGANSATAVFNWTVTQSYTMMRPSYNTGSGYFVVNGQLYDPSGYLVNLRGFCNNHYDNGSTIPSISKAYGNAARIASYRVGSGGVANSTYVTTIQTAYGSPNFIVPIFACWYVPGTGTLTSGDSTIADFHSCASWWASSFSDFSAIQNNMLLELYNEPKISTNSAWATMVEADIATVRAAGYTCPIVVPTNGQGQDVTSITTYAAAIVASDPLQSIIFDYHLYGGTANYEFAISNITKASNATISFTSPLYGPQAGGSNTGNPFYQPQFNTLADIFGVSTMTQINGVQVTITGWGPASAGPATWTLGTSENTSTFTAYGSGGGYVYHHNHYRFIISQLAAIRATGAAVFVGEYGPGRYVGSQGASPNWVTVENVVLTCEQNGVGWNQWAMDDNSGNPDNTWWNMTYNATTGQYTTPSSLVFAGLEGVWNPDTGSVALAVPCSYLI